MRVPEVKPNAIDRLVSYFDPVRGMERHRARMVLAMTGGGYTGARRDRRATQEWYTSAGSADADLLPDLAKLRDRSGDLVRNAPLASGAIATTVTNVVGTGLWPRPQPDRELLGLSDEAADSWEKQVVREWWLWADSYECDITRTQKFCEMQDLSLRSPLERGDVFVVRYYRDRPGSPYGLTLGFIESDRVANPRALRDGGTLPNGNRVCGGVELDSDGAPVAYHVLQQHPGDLGAGRTYLSDRFEVFGETGDRRILHLFDKRRVDQRRGVPYLAPVIEALKQLDRYTEAEISAAVVSAFFTVFTKTATGTGLGPMEPTTETGGKTTDKDYKMAPGAILDLAPGEDIQLANPMRPNAAFGPFCDAVFQQVGIALEIPKEVLMKHFQSSFSASKGALLEAWKFFRRRRVWLSDNFCQPVYEWVISEAVARGRITAPGYFDDPLIRAGWLGCLWIGPPAGTLDEEAEANAAEKWIDIGVKTIEQVTTETTGGDFDANHKQLAKERAMRVRDGLDLENFGQRTLVESSQPAPAKETQTRKERQAAIEGRA